MTSGAHAQRVAGAAAREDPVVAARTTVFPVEARMGSVAQSRQILLEEIGAAPELTFIRGYGNMGDELIWAGTRELLSGHVYREIGIEELASSGGEVGLLCGGGAFSRGSNEFMPEALAIAEMRFERVIVLPSSFEVEEDRVREILRRTRATVFAREHESYRRIAGLCRARLAHDCSFFFDFSQYSAPGSGTLVAYRTDLERATEGRLPEGNEDISVTCATLPEWLSAISRHEVVLTDRAHVAIAAALMGKQVRYSSCSYFKLDAIAASCLQGFPVQKIEIAPNPVEELYDPEPPIVSSTRARLRETALSTPPPAPAGGRGAARVTALILSRNRPRQVLRAICSVLETSAPVRVLVLDQNSRRPTRAALQTMADAHTNVDIRLSNRNLGCAGGRKHLVELADTEFVLFLDDDAELLPGALEHMVADLDTHPGAAAVTPLVVYTDGTVFHFGGWVEASRETVSFELHGHRSPFDDADLAETGPSGWVPGTAALIRRELFGQVPIDDRMAYFEDNDWCLRVEQQRPGSFRRCREAIALHALHEETQGSSFIRRAHLVQHLAMYARFLRTHGLQLENSLRNLVPSLQRANGHFDHASARLLLEIVSARGTDWTLMEWMNGGLDPLLDGGHRETESLRVQVRLLREEEERLREEVEVLRAHAQEAKERQLAQLHWLRERHTMLVSIENSRWWRLGIKLAPARRAWAAVRRITVPRRG